MRFVDAIGNELAENDPVTVALGGELALGKVIKFHTGLGMENTPESQPSVIIMVMIQRPTAPNGMTPGIVKAHVPPAQPLIKES